MDRNSRSVDLRRVSPHPEAKFASVSSMVLSRINKIGVLVKSVEVRCEEGNNNEGEDCAMLRKMYGTVLVGHKGSPPPGVVKLSIPQNCPNVRGRIPVRALDPRSKYVKIS